MFIISHAWEDLLIIATVILAFRTLKRTSPFPYHVLAWMTLASLPVDAASIVLARRYHDNSWLFNVWEPLECLYVLLVFYSATVHRVTRRINRTLLYLLPVGTIITFGLQPHFLKMNLYGLQFYLFCDLISTCVFLVDGLVRSEDAAFFQHPLSWTAAGIALHCIISLLCYGMWKFVVEWPTFYIIAMFMANGVFFIGTMLTFIHLRKASR
jgi:hypothetical protein